MKSGAHWFWMKSNRKDAKERRLRVTDMVTVCNSCLTAACWQGQFYCDNYRRAGTTEKSVGELLRLGKESAYYLEVKSE